MTREERRRERDRVLIKTMIRHGIVDPSTTLRVARKVNREHGQMPLSRACALLEKETDGGQNVWGHDADRHGCIPPCGGAVTRESYGAYLKRRRADKRQQGCGPTQLTFFAFQDEADKLGGCWKPDVNMYVGLSHLAENIKRNGVHAGMRLYNGSGPNAEAYARDLRAKEARWRGVFEAALSKAPGPPPATRPANPAPRPAKPRVIARGHKGAAVAAMTRRLSFVPSPTSGQPYLDGQRRVFDVESERALRLFQTEHGLKVSGRFGPRSSAFLARAVAAEKRRRANAGAKQPAMPPGGQQARPTRPARPPGGPAGAAQPGSGAPKRGSAELLALLERLDLQGDRTRAALVERHRRLERALARERKRFREIERELKPVASPSPPAMRLSVTAPVATPVVRPPVAAVPAAPESPQVPESSATPTGEAQLVAVSAATQLASPPGAAPQAFPITTNKQSRLLEDLLVDVRSGVQEELAREREERMSVEAELRASSNGLDPRGETAPLLAPAPPPAPAGSAPPAAGLPPPGGQGSLTAGAAQAPEPGLGELTERLVRLDHERDGIRALLVARYAELERKVVRARRRRLQAEARLGVARGLPAALPPAPSKRPPASGKRPPAPAPGRRPPAPAPPKPGRGARPGGSVVVTSLGDRGPVVRQSKVALIRYLRANRPKSTHPLRKALRREVRSPSQAQVATKTWQAAVSRTQKAVGHPITGQLDGRLHAVLRPHWPRDSVVRRVARSTPAWRMIPGQLTPNFNVREFGCKDGTGYVQGLMREQGLSKRAARERAAGLARRLEAVRRLGGDRPLQLTSAFRTKAHNASVGGESNSAHLRGFAVDIPPPSGVALRTHRAHVRASFESGVGFYPSDNFVHGDFDPKLGRRSWNG